MIGALILPLDHSPIDMREVASSKASALSALSDKGFNVPKCICLTAQGYQSYISETVVSYQSIFRALIGILAEA